MALDPQSADRPLPARPGARVAVVLSEFHSELTGAMLGAARQELVRGGVAADDIEVARVPGAFELPLVARRFARRREIDAVLCLGLVLKGETTHDQHVAAAAAHGILQVALETDTPVLFGVLTCQTLEQARARALPVEQGGREDKGREVARAALSMLAALDAATAATSTTKATRATAADADAGACDAGSRMDPR